MGVRFRVGMSWKYLVTSPDRFPRYSKNMSPRISWAKRGPEMPRVHEFSLICGYTLMSEC